MGFIESLLGSGLSNAIALHSVASAFKEEAVRSDTVNQPDSKARTDDYREELLARGSKAKQDVKHEEAEHLLIRAIKLDPYDPTGYGLLGSNYQILGQYDNALECYDKCLSLQGNVYQGNVYVNSDEFIQSVRNLMKICEDNLGITTPKVESSAGRNKVNARRKSTTEPIRSSTKVDAEKSRKRGELINKIGVIKEFRTITGEGLREALAAINAYEDGDISRDVKEQVELAITRAGGEV